MMSTFFVVLVIMLSIFGVACFLPWWGAVVMGVVLLSFSASIGATGAAKG